MANSHDKAARLVARRVKGRYNPASSPDVKGKRGSAEVKSSAIEIPQALQQLSGISGHAYIVLPRREHGQALKRLIGLKTGLMNYQGKIVKRSTRK
jgi:hypothetical protein